MRGGARRRVAFAQAFAGLAGGYWLDVFPRVREELRGWRRHAVEIPNSRLRDAALTSLDSKAGNVEGAAAFATLAPRARRPQLVRLLVAFQAMHDYLDTVSEQSANDMLANGRQLHRALVVALDEDRPHDDYYRFCTERNDGGYLRRYVEACQAGVQCLPGYPSVASAARRAASLSGEAQSRLHAGDGWCDGGRWARAFLREPSWLADWEIAAAACSTLTIYALLATASEWHEPESDTALIEAAYFPWITGVSTLLDSLADEASDTAVGSYSHVGTYEDPAAAVDRLQALIGEAVHRASLLPSGAKHTLIVSGMLGYYLVGSEDAGPSRLGPTRHDLARRCLPLRWPITFVFRLRDLRWRGPRSKMPAVR